MIKTTFTISWPSNNNREFIELVKEMIEPIVDYKMDKEKYLSEKIKEIIEPIISDRFWTDFRCIYCHEYINVRDPINTEHKPDCTYKRCQELMMFIEDNYSAE